MLGANDFLPLVGAVCPRCGKRIELSDLERPLAGRSPPTPEPGQTLTAAQTEKNNKLDEAAPLPDDEDFEENEPQYRGSRAGWRLDVLPVGAFVAGSLAVMLASIPTLVFLSKPLSLLGLVLALLSSLVPPLRKHSYVAFPLAIAVFCLVTWSLVGNKPRVTGPPPMVSIPFDKGGMIADEPIKEGDWVDASSNAVRLHDLRIQVEGITIGGVKVEVGDKKGFTQKKHLVIKLRASYEGTRPLRTPYESWVDLAGSPSKNRPILTDNLKNTYVQDTFEPSVKVVGRDKSRFVTGGHQVHDILVFPEPGPGMEFLRLELSGAAFGMKDQFRLHIPRAMIKASETGTLP
jgi:hypothetical protein